MKVEEILLNHVEEIGIVDIIIDYKNQMEKIKRKRKKNKKKCNNKFRPKRNIIKDGRLSKQDFRNRNR